MSTAALTLTDVDQRTDDGLGAKRRWWTAVVLITLGGTAARIAYIHLFRDHDVPGLVFNGKPYVTRVWGDGFVYHKQANLLVDGKGLIAPLPTS